MRLHIMTLCLDGMPFLPMQLNIFNSIPSWIPWTWYIVEGAAANKGSTSWCAEQEPRLSRDGSSELLTSWISHPRIQVIRKQFWDGGKDEMCNAAVARMTEPGILLQVDVDELWTGEQIFNIVRYFEARPEIVTARFYCRYFVGPNLVITTTDTYGNLQYEWIRAWRYKPGMTFIRHEGPEMTGGDTPFATREETRAAGLVFDHWAYVFRHQLAYKSKFYKYPNAVPQWQKLQSNTVWPARLADFFGWVTDGAMVDLLHR